MDYVIRDEETMEGVKKIEVEDRINSDQHLLTVWIEEERKLK